MLNTPMHWIASGGGIGRVPFAPGTVASLAAVLIGALVLWIDHRLPSTKRTSKATPAGSSSMSSRDNGSPCWALAASRCMG